MPPDPLHRVRRPPFIEPPLMKTWIFQVDLLFVGKRAIVKHSKVYSGRRSVFLDISLKTPKFHLISFKEREKQERRGWGVGWSPLKPQLVSCKMIMNYSVVGSFSFYICLFQRIEVAALNNIRKPLLSIAKLFPLLNLCSVGCQCAFNEALHTIYSQSGLNFVRSHKLSQYLERLLFGQVRPESNLFFPFDHSTQLIVLINSCVRYFSQISAQQLQWRIEIMSICVIILAVHCSCTYFLLLLTTERHQKALEQTWLKEGPCRQVDFPQSPVRCTH